MVRQKFEIDIDDRLSAKGVELLIEFLKDTSVLRVVSFEYDYDDDILSIVKEAWKDE